MSIHYYVNFSCHSSNFLVYSFDLTSILIQFSLCIEDLVPVALGRFIKALVSSMHQAGSGALGSSEHQLEKMFSLFMEQGNLWPEIFTLPEIRSPEISEASLYT